MGTSLSEKHIRPLRILVGLLVMLTLVLVACGDSDDEPTPLPTATTSPTPRPSLTPTPESAATSAEVDPEKVIIAKGQSIHIGVATDLSNILPAPGLDIAQAAALAIQEYNADGGLMGFEVEAIVEDDLCTAEGATDVAEGFITDPDLVAVVGHVCSGASIPASEIYQEARIPMVSASSTAGVFTDRGLDIVNRVAFNDNAQGVVAARFMHDVLGANQIAVLHNQTSYGEGIARTVALTFDDLGGNLLAFEAISIDAEDYTGILTDLKKYDPDLIYLGGYNDEAAKLVEEMHALGMEDVLFFSDDGVYNQDFLDSGGEFVEGAYVTFGRQSGDPGKNAVFSTNYENEYGVAPDALGPFHAQAYDSAKVILMALENAASLDEDGNLVIDRESLITAIRATRRYRGLSGLITCDEKGDCGSATIAVFQVINGTWQEVDVPDELQMAR